MRISIVAGKRLSSLRGIALFTLMTFFATQVMAFPSTAFAQSPKTPGNDSISVSARQASSESSIIPPGLGTVEEIYHGLGSPKTVLFIQDAHDSFEAQENISKMIGHLVEKRGVRTVFEEGYEGPVPTDKYFGFIKDPELKQKVAWFFLDHLRIGGAEYAHINRKTNFKLVGADSIKLHKENINQYRLSAERKEAIAQDLKALGTEVASLASKRFSKELLEWMKLKDRFDAKKIDLLDYLGRTIKLLVQKNALSGDRLALLRFLLEARSTHDPNVMEKIKHIDAREIYAELMKLEEAIGEAYLKDATDQELFSYCKALGLLNRLNDLQVTQEEYAAVKALLKAFNTESLGLFIHKNARKPLVLSRQWEHNLRDAIQFYEVAKSRDQSMEKQLEGFIKDPKETTAVLVFGGFHKENIKRILESKGLAYQVVSPRITKSSLRHEQFYKKLMTVGSFPFERMSLPATAVPAERIWELSNGGSDVRMVFNALSEHPDRLTTLDQYLGELSTNSQSVWVRSEMRLPSAEEESVAASADAIIVKNHRLELKTLTPTLLSQHREEIFKLYKLIKTDKPHVIQNEIENRPPFDPELSRAVFDAQSKVVGYSIVSEVNYDKKFAAGTAISLERLSVDPDYQGTGLSAWLLHRIFLNAKKRGYLFARWSTVRDDNLAALKFYDEKVGAKRIKEVSPREKATIPDIWYVVYEVKLDTALEQLQRVFQNAGKLSGASSQPEKGEGVQNSEVKSRSEMRDVAIRNMRQIFEGTSVPMDILEEVIRALEMLASNRPEIFSAAEFNAFLNNPDHGIQHSLQVTKQVLDWVQSFGLRMAVDLEHLVVGAFLHDIKGLEAEGNDQRGNHHEAGAELVEILLRGMGWDRRPINRVRDIIRGHRGVPENYRVESYPEGYMSEKAMGMPKPYLVESQLVRDADTLVELINLERLMQITQDFRKSHSPDKKLTDKFYYPEGYSDPKNKLNRLEVILNRNSRERAINTDVLEYLLGKLLENCDWNYYVSPQVQELVRKEAPKFFRHFLELTLRELKREGTDSSEVLLTIESLIQEMGKARIAGNPEQWRELNKFHQKMFQESRLGMQAEGKIDSAFAKKIFAKLNASEKALIDRLLRIAETKRIPTEYAINVALPALIVATRDRPEEFKEAIAMGMRLAEEGIPFCSSLEFGVPVASNIAKGNMAEFRRDLLVIEELARVLAPEGINPYRTLTEGREALAKFGKDAASLKSTLEVARLIPQWFRAARTNDRSDLKLKDGLAALIAKCDTLETLRQALELEIAFAGRVIVKGEIKGRLRVTSAECTVRESQLNILKSAGYEIVGESLVHEEYEESILYRTYEIIYAVPGEATVVYHALPIYEILDQSEGSDFSLTIKRAHSLFSVFPGRTNLDSMLRILSTYRDADDQEWKTLLRHFMTLEGERDYRIYGSSSEWDRVRAKLSPYVMSMLKPNSVAENKYKEMILFKRIIEEAVSEKRESIANSFLFTVEDLKKLLGRSEFDKSGVAKLRHDVNEEWRYVGSQLRVMEDDDGNIWAVFNNDINARYDKFSIQCKNALTRIKDFRDIEEAVRVMWEAADENFDLKLSTPLKRAILKIIQTLRRVPSNNVESEVASAERSISELERLAKDGQLADVKDVEHDFRYQRGLHTWDEKKSFYFNTPGAFKSGRRSEMRQPKVALELKLRESAVVVIEKKQFEEMSEVQLRQLMGLAVINKEKLRLVVPDMLGGRDSSYLSDLRALGVRISSDLPEIARDFKVQVIAFSDKEHDTAEAFQKRLGPRLAKGVKEYFALEGGEGIFLALLVARPEDLSIKNGFRYDKAGRYQVELHAILQNLLASYFVISSAA